MLGRRCAAVFIGLSAWMLAYPAHGQQSTDAASPPAAEGGKSSEKSQPESGGVNAEARERAKQLYEQGVTAYRQGRYSDAIDQLLEADRVMPNAAFSYNIALVYEQMGDQRSALRWLRSYLRQSGKAVNDEATSAKVRKFEGELQARGLQQVSILSNPAGATLQVDGHALGLTPFTTELTPGMHRVALTLQGYAPVQKDFELRSDRSLDVEIALDPQTSIDQQAPEPTQRPPATPEQQLQTRGPQAQSTTASSPTTQGSTPVVPAPQSPVDVQSSAPRVHVWTWIGLGVGAALLGGGAVFEFDRRRLENRAESASQVDYQTRYDKMDTAKTLSRVFTGVGAAAMLTGVTLLTVDLARPKNKHLAAVGGCTGIGPCVQIRGQF